MTVVTKYPNGETYVRSFVVGDGEKQWKAKKPQTKKIAKEETKIIDKEEY